MPENKTTKIALSIGIVFILYISISLLVFWVRHPELTQMQVLMRFPEALLWR